MTRLFNKVDASGGAPGLRSREPAAFGVSAHTGAGLGELSTHLRDCMGFAAASEGEFTARRRHLEALRQCRQHLTHATRQLQLGAGELAAEELRLAQIQLGEITGEFSSDDLLGRIFTSFCIGK